MRTPVLPWGLLAISAACGLNSQSTEAELKKCRRNCVDAGAAPDGPLSADASIAGVDENGIKLLGAPKPDGRNWYLDIDGLGTLVPAPKNRIHPSGDPRFEFEAAGATIMQESGIRFVRLDRLDPTTDTTMLGSNKARIHVFAHMRGDADPANVEYNWRTGAASTGYMVHPDDIKAAEYTLIARIYVLDGTDSISFNLGGAGHHLDPNGQVGTGLGNNANASTYESHFQYSGAVSRKQFSTEFDHGYYERYHMTPINSYGNVHNQWMGFKVVTMPAVDRSARLVSMYFNEDPIDPQTGTPRNDGWKLYVTWRQTHYRGEPAPHIWGGAMDTWRLDWLLYLDVAYSSIVEITAMP